MKYETSFVSGGKLIGEFVYICDLRFNDFANKPIRHIRPTKVLVRDSKSFKKKIYYSNVYFSPLKKNEEPSAKVIVLFDSTGFRSYTGEPLSVFDNIEECEAFYKEQVEVANKGLDGYLKAETRRITSVKNSLI